MLGAGGSGVTAWGGQKGRGTEWGGQQNSGGGGGQGGGQGGQGVGLAIKGDQIEQPPQPLRDAVARGPGPALGPHRAWMLQKGTTGRRVLGYRPHRVLPTSELWAAPQL